MSVDLSAKAISDLLNEVIGHIDHGPRKDLIQKLVEVRDALNFREDPIVPEGDLIPEAMWGGLARSVMMWLDFDDRKTPRELFKHLKRCGAEIPEWMKEETELKNLDHTISKGTRCVIVYKAMREEARKLQAVPSPSDYVPTHGLRIGLGDSVQRPLEDLALRNPITSFPELIAWLQQVTTYQWVWSRNTPCKYVTIHLDTRSGAHLFKNRDGEEITFDQVKYQYSSQSDQDRTSI